LARSFISTTPQYDKLRWQVFSNAPSNQDALLATLHAVPKIAERPSDAEKFKMSASHKKKRSVAEVAPTTNYSTRTSADLKKR